MTRPQQALLYALMEDLKPKVTELRALGWPAEVRVEVGDLVEQGMKVVVEIDLGPGIHVPVEAQKGDAP